MNFLPWRFPILNYFDAFSSAANILLLTCFAMLGGLEAKLGAEEVGWFIIILFCSLFVTLILAGVVKMVFRFSRGKEYGMFLCHAKSTSGLFGRQVKMMFEATCSRRVFLDVDELENLDNLNFTVRANTDNFLIMVTTETFSRFWCALEIVSASMNNVRTLVVDTTPDAASVLTEDFIKDVHNMWGALERAELDKLGITLDDVEKGYRHVSTLPRMKLFYADTFENQYAQVKDIRSNIVKCPSYEKTIPADPLQTAYVVFNTESTAQTCVARIMHLLLKRARWNSQICDESITGLQKPAVAGSTATGVVLISKDIMRNPLSVAIVSLMFEQEIPVVTVLSQEDFPQISETSYNILAEGSELAQKVDGHVKNIGGGTNVPNIVAPVKALFKILAWRFNPQDSFTVLITEFDRIMERLKMAKKPDKEAIMNEVQNSKTVSNPEALKKQAGQ
jgi:hypothetical protein